MPEPRHCPIAGCGERIAVDRLFCAPHWRMVPPAVKREVWRTFDRRDGEPIAYGQAVIKATRAVHNAIGFSFPKVV